jgi:multiple sugar transport system ATP-binding protein
MTLADRIVVMDKGEVQQVGRPLEVFEHPANRFVAGFIGSPAMNFIPCTLSEEGVLSGDGFKLPVHPDHREAVQGRSGAMELGLRPGHLQVLADAGSERSDVLRASVEVREPMGSETFLYLAVGEEMVTVREKAHSGVKVGDAVAVQPDMQQAHLFDARTGETVF